MPQFARNRRALVLLAPIVIACAVAFGHSAHRDRIDTDRLLVGLRPDAPAGAVDGDLAALGARVDERVDQIQLLVVDARPGEGEAAAERLRRNPAVRYVAPDRAIFSLASAPNDPSYQQGKQWNIDRVQAPQAWDLLPPGGNTIVAVLDTGIDYRHPEFAGKISPAACDNFYGRCNGATSRPEDIAGHGTHVAGIIGAATNNGVGVASVSGGRVTLLPIKVLSNGYGQVQDIPLGGTVSESTYAPAIVYAVDHGAKVINMSFGGSCGAYISPATYDAITYAVSHDVLLVVAAGNEGGCPDGAFPANDRRVISVAATDASDRPPSFTNQGSFVAVAAPGAGILSTFPMESGGYATKNGTSQAAPHVAAEAALLFQVPGATLDKVESWIMQTCDPAPIKVRCGGRINVYRAVALAMTGKDPGAPGAAASPAPSPTPASPGTPVPSVTAAPSPTVTSTPVSEPVLLAEGCNNIAATWPDGTAMSVIVDAVNPSDAVEAIWAYDAAAGRFRAFAPRFPDESDFQSVQRLQAIVVCMQAGGSLMRPAR